MSSNQVVRGHIDGRGSAVLHERIASLRARVGWLEEKAGVAPGTPTPEVAPNFDGNPVPAFYRFFAARGVTADSPGSESTVGLVNSELDH